MTTPVKLISFSIVNDATNLKLFNVNIGRHLNRQCITSFSAVEYKQSKLLSIYYKSEGTPEKFRTTADETCRAITQTAHC